jgi:hypothetical protein
MQRQDHHWIRLLRRQLSRVLLLVMFCGSAFAAENKQGDPGQVDFFETKIRPVFVEHCYECHTGQSKIVREGLRLDSREGLLEGGDSGASVVLGGAAASLLVSVLRYEDYEMPPKEKLSDVVVRDFENWIAYRYITRGMIGESELALMLPESFLINTSRGGVVHTNAVVEALAAGRLRGAGIDVLEKEPPPDDSLVLMAWRDPNHPAHHRLILNPHAALYCEEGCVEFRTKAAREVLRALQGTPVRNRVN